MFKVLFFNYQQNRGGLCDFGTPMIDSFPLCLFWVLSFIYQQNGVGGGVCEFRTSTNRLFFVLSVLRHISFIIKMALISRTQTLPNCPL